MSLAPPTSSGGVTTVASTKEAFNLALRSRNADNKYISHLKIWETVADEPSKAGAAAAAQRKARYLILAVQADGTGKVTLNKAKRNANGSFSIGKDWDVNTLREITVHEPDAFTLTLSRSYSWQTERPREQMLFLQSLVKVYRKYTRDTSGPRCVGLELPEASPAAAPAPSVPVVAAAPEPAPLTLNTALPRNLMDRSRDSPVRTPTSRTPSASDGFYDPRARAASPHETTPPAQRRPAPSRSASGDVPAIVLSSTDSAMSNGSATSPPSNGLRRERSPLSTNGRSTSSDDVASMTAKDLDAPSTDSVASRLSSTGSSSTLGPERNDAARATPSAPARPAKKRTGSSDGSSAAGSIGVFSSGDARARLSAVEPVRGGAAYERMLLAGTGLAGVTEGDEEDAYGGADIQDVSGTAGGAAAAMEGIHSFKPPPRAAPKRKMSIGAGRRGIGRMDSDEARGAAGEEDDEEDTTLLNVEEILEGFEWRQSATVGLTADSTAIALRRIGAAPGTAGKGHADVIEARLLDELAALDAANIHAIIESDDRVNLVVKHMEEALNQLDAMDSMIAGFKVRLNARADDISHIESQNRGLQVQTSNQRTLAAEIEKLLSTVHVDDSAVGALMYAGLSDDEGIADAERAAAALYKAMLQARRTDEEHAAGAGVQSTMAAATERLEEYENLAESFAKRLLQHLTREFNGQTQEILNDPGRMDAMQPPHPTLRDHTMVEDKLGRYCGLLLYAKEVSPEQFQRISAAYFASASERYRHEMVQLFQVWKEQLRKPSEEDLAEASFILPSGPSGTAAALRSGTIRRVAGGSKERGGKSAKGGEANGYEAFSHILSTVIPLIMREEAFISDLLHINDNAITFADYVDLEPYFRRRAAAIFASDALASAGPLREMKGALDLIFSFLAPEWQGFADTAIQRDRVQIVGILAGLDRAIIEAEELSSEFLLRSLAKLHMRLAALLERFVAEQIKGIEQTKLTVKKRKGVAHFIKVFPVFVDRIEAQLVNAEALNIRVAVDGYYEQISRTMFDALQAMAKMEGAGSIDDDKSALNHHVILIENMHHFVAECSKQRVPALQPLVVRAQGLYDDHVAAYVHAVLRRPVGKMMDFGDGIDALLRSTPANEVSLHSAYTRSNFKKLVKENSAKDVRKAVEALAKRVQKHFGLDDDDVGPAFLAGSTAEAVAAAAEEAAEVLARVWKACEDAFVREAERQARIARDCYANAVTVEFTPDDVRRPFAANAPGSGKKR